MPMIGASIMQRHLKLFPVMHFKEDRHAEFACTARYSAA